MEEQLNLYQKLAKIRKLSDAVAKDKRGFNYTYAEITQILAKVTTGMNQEHVSLIPFITPGTAVIEQNVTVKTKVTKNGDVYDEKKTEMLIKARMVFRWINDENPEEYIEVPWLLVGAQEDPSQGFGSALTYCTRYFLTSYFQIGQDNDIDAYRSKQKTAEAEQNAAIASEIIVQINMLVNTYLNKHPDRREQMLKLIQKYIKSGDYTKIKDATLAAKLLEEINTQFINKEEE